MPKGRNVRYANKSLITLPLLAIFIGRPLLLVKVVSREMSRARKTLAMRSSELYASLSTSMPSAVVLPTTMPGLKPAPPTTALQARAK